MDKRFFNLFNLSEDQAIAILNTPQEQVGENDSRYIAASHLVNFPTKRSIEALIGAVQSSDPSLDNRIVRRKSIEILGRLQAKQAVPAIRTCLMDPDCYTVENAVWAIGEIGTDQEDILKEITQLLDKPEQNYRAIIHTLAKLNYQPALEHIHQRANADDELTASAAISAVCRFTGNYTLMEKVVNLLQHKNVLVRRLSIQDLIDANYYDAIPQIARCPVSVVFRLRAIRLLADGGVPAQKITFEEIKPHLEQTLRDRPEELNLVHNYDQLPSLTILVRELYNTDFGRCYLAAKTILEHYPEEAPQELFATYASEANNDYGAHYHVMKLMGWLKHAPAYDLLVESLHNQKPQFQKSRVAAAIALGELGQERAIKELKKSLKTPIWNLKYSALMALEQLGDFSDREIALEDPDWLIRAKATHNRA
jgi:bilin biosynthesis protein